MNDKFQASVKVMRSYDYCHFEVALSTDEPLDLDGVNELRKRAAVLVDEAIRQYRQAKEKERSREHSDFQKQQFLDRIERIKAKPHDEWSSEEAAVMRSHEDRTFWAAFDDDEFYYCEDPDRDHHFSMLRKFQNVTVKG